MLKENIFESVCFVAVTYNEYNDFNWSQICVSSFREIFPHQDLVFVDHNENPQEIEFLIKKDVKVIKGHPKKTHGFGLDVAADYCRENNHKIMIAIEPDCIFTEKTWAKNLIKSIKSGNKMASTFKYNYGLLHPCGSAWSVKDIPASFDVQSNAKEVGDKEFRQIMNYELLFESMVEQKYSNDLLWFFTHLWDTGMKNSYIHQKNKSAELVDKTGFIHFWGSHKKSTNRKQGFEYQKKQFEELNKWKEKLNLN